MTSSIKNSPYSSQNFSKEFDKSLKNWTSYKSNKTLPVTGKGRLKLVGIKDIIKENLRGILSSSKRTDSKLVEYRLIDFLQLGIEAECITANHLRQLYAIAKRIGLVIGNKKREAAHPDLTDLLKEIMENFSQVKRDPVVFTEDYAKRFFIKHEKHL